MFCMKWTAQLIYHIRLHIQYYHEKFVLIEIIACKNQRENVQIIDKNNVSFEGLTIHYPVRLAVMLVLMSVSTFMTADFNELVGSIKLCELACFKCMFVVNT
jgi:hypothetical protein